METSKKILICVNVVLYIVHLVLNGLSAAGTSSLFPYSVSDISKAFTLELTPVGATFSIWGAIFAWQILWIIYTVVTTFRSDKPSANILSIRFFVAFILNIVFISAWLFVWARKQIIAALVVIIIGQICVDTAIAFAMCDLKRFIDGGSDDVNKWDVWCQRMLVQNGLIFYATWTTVASLINIAVVVAYRGSGATTYTASIISLSILAVFAVGWFVLESFLLTNYATYTFSAYITLIIACSGVYKANNTAKGNGVLKWFSLALVIVAAVFLVVRLIIIGIRHKKKEGETVVA